MDRRLFLRSLVALPAALTAVPVAAPRIASRPRVWPPATTNEETLCVAREVEKMYTSYCSFDVSCVEGVGIWGTRGQ